MTARRRLLAVAAGSVILSSQPAEAQLVVFDVAVVGRQTATASFKELILNISKQTHDVIDTMSTGLRKIRSMRDYTIMRAVGWLDVPASYITQPSEMASQFMNVLQGGGAVAESVKRLDVDPRMLGSSMVHSSLVTLDAADSVLAAGADLAGRIRHRGPEEAAAMRRLERDVVSGADSTTAALDTLSGAALIRARQQETRIQLMTILNETLVVDTLRERQTEAASARMRAGLAAYHQRIAEGNDEGGYGWTDSLRTWRQP